MLVDCDYTAQTIKSLKDLRQKYNEAILAFLANDAILSYNIDTGQTRQQVKRESLKDLFAILRTLDDQIIAMIAMQRSTCLGLGAYEIR